MNLFFRLVWTSLISRFRAPVSPLGPCRTPFRCWPTDLDVLRHMNNGVYLSILDLGRVDLMIRAGMASKLASKGWYPVVVAETIRFRRSLNLWNAFVVETNVVGWDEKAILLSQKFLRGQDIVAEAVIRARFLRKTGGSVPSSEVFALAGITGGSPAIPDWIRDWNANQV